MAGMLIIVVLFLAGAASLFVQSIVFRALAGRQPIAAQLRVLSGMPMLGLFYFLIVPPLAVCLGMPHLVSIIGYLLAIGALSTFFFIIQLIVFYLTLEQAICIHRTNLAAENREVKDRLIWYLKTFRWVPGKRLQKEEIQAIIAELSERKTG